MMEMDKGEFSPIHQHLLTSGQEHVEEYGNRTVSRQHVLVSPNLKVDSDTSRKASSLTLIPSSYLPPDKQPVISFLYKHSTSV